MSSKTKYQPAPQRDSLEEANYTQAPPSYQAETSGHRDILGGPGAKMATCQMTSRTLQILATIAVSSVSYFSTGYKTWIQSNSWMMWVSLLGAIGFMLLTFWKLKSYPTNLLFLSGFTALEAHPTPAIVSFYETKIVLEALILTAGIFVALTLFACQTKYDFTSWMPYLFGGLWGLIIFGFLAAFFPYNSTAELIYGGIAALIFSAYILVDTQLIMRYYHVEEEIAAAISLYLDIINLFLAILRILNSQSNN
ncbi:hypothetical protein MMC07_001104 [Pseudocyphellaria aurata]|nr:hypothetical protein [Pseudocyphellaria aurata]